MKILQHARKIADRAKTKACQEAPNKSVYVNIDYFLLHKSINGGGKTLLSPVGNTRTHKQTTIPGLTCITILAYRDYMLHDISHYDISDHPKIFYPVNFI